MYLFVFQLFSDGLAIITVNIFLFRFMLISAVIDHHSIFYLIVYLFCFFFLVTTIDRHCGSFSFLCFLIVVSDRR